MITAGEANKKAKIAYEEEFDSAIKGTNRQINEEVEDGNTSVITHRKIMLDEFKRVKEYYSKLGFKVKKKYNSWYGQILEISW